jgi:glycosyltransferase involved in cell wall biosynthesis
VKKVLIIANLFHASPRIPGLAKYLPEFGWQPIILTMPLGDRPSERFGPPNDFRENNRVIETSSPPKDVGVHVKKGLSSKKYGYLRPLLKFLYRRYSEIVHYPDEEKGWKSLAVKAGDELLQNEDIDAMISCSSPVTTHIIAKELKEKHKIPWVADFRDLWTQNHNYQYSILRKLFEKRLELKTLSTADALVTVSPLWTEKLKMLHKGKRTYTITNGFDPEKMSDGKANLTSTFTITRTGQIYTKQDPTKLLAALKDLISERAVGPKDVDVRFYGPENELLANRIEEYGLSTIVRQCGIVPREISLEKQRESQLLLLLKWEDPQERGVIPGKVFEYLAARRPVLATGGTDDVVKELLNETSAGIDAQTVEDIKSALRKLYAEYKLKGKIISQENTEKINRYSYREMAKNFVEVINKTIQH